MYPVDQPGHHQGELPIFDFQSSQRLRSTSTAVYTPHSGHGVPWPDHLQGNFAPKPSSLAHNILPGMEHHPRPGAQSVGGQAPPNPRYVKPVIRRMGKSIVPEAAQLHT